MRAVIVQELGYVTLKRLSRNGLEYGFAPGASLWTDPGRYRRPVAPCAVQTPGAAAPTPDCASYLDANRRAALQWRLEGWLREFEQSSG